MDEYNFSQGRVALIAVEKMVMGQPTTLVNLKPLPYSIVNKIG